MDLDVALLSRLQFAFTVSFHIIFPSITIGLATLIAIWEGLWLKTHNPYYLQLAKFWIKPFAITFGMGVVSGIVLSYEFGTNFSRFSEMTGAVLGPLMAYEVLTAFFMEAGFLGVMLFGWQRVGRKLHFFATTVVMVGTWFSAFWIIVANSWMQTPAGYIIVDGHFEVASWMEVIFNPSMPYRLMHMLMASLITATFVVAGISAYYLLKKQHIPFARKGLSMCMWFALVLTPLQAWVGDMHGLNVKEHQPTKLAAIEGIWPAEENNVPLLLFAMPNMATESNDYEIAIPNLGSLLLTHSWDGALQGLKAVPAADRPNVPLVFWSFRVMVGIGFGMICIALLALALRRKERLFESKPLLALVTLFTPSGVIAVLAGWYVVEVGRQPWIVYNLVRTADIVSPLPAERVLFTLIMFVLIYTSLLGVYLYFMRKLIKKGPPTMNALEEQLIGMDAPGYALAWVKNLNQQERGAK
ncbi:MULTISPECIES: cytochrome ubiquinol oxidase subunit I [unclassified Oceanobacter]|uniref:cytochrome ubiquinol oxidase subunit I n=1 Tax=unclassified Oceanobacter TaxID=2620260 RepID=UPI0027333416|nr:MULTISPECIES: cytochrome ubiquinol oxidase subunit I [unclassified Oceanobacter]MDP2610269.1 cytochrome ubiquinol oxidase subunit I [Oceanobacter sp. 1_MG-2023]MDP2613593.1 cytochrome ubiquinol oxidase subunit I [Oceanobacter sp. 2_MG-2023]